MKYPTRVDTDLIVPPKTMNQNPLQTDNADDLVAREIELYKSRVYFLNKELEECEIYPNRINLLIQLSAAVTALLMLESNQQTSKASTPN